MPQDQNVSIFRGRSIEIPLRAIGRASSQLKFLIRSRPSTGRLGEIRLIGPKSAVITYTHDESSPEGIDSFTYAVQGADTPVSAPGRVNIAISEEPPALSVVHSLDFGHLLLGETSEEQITIRNAGGGVLSGKMAVPEPWKILGPADYKLGRKQEKKIRILFDPQEDASFKGKLAFSHDFRSYVELAGAASSPFEFQPPDKIELDHTDTGSIRSAVLVIRNKTARERIMGISAPPEIVVSEEIVLPPGSERRIPLHTKPGFSGALDAKLSVESDGFQRSFALRVFPLKPVLKIDPADGLDFGEVQPDRRYKATFSVKNEGGRDAHLQAKMPPKILVVPDPNTVVLAPGENRLLEVAFESRSEGEYRGDIEIGTEGAPAQKIPVTARIAGHAALAPKVSTTRLAPAPAAPVSAQPAASPMEALSGIPAIRNIQIRGAGNKTQEVVWEKPAPNAVAYIVEQRMLEPGTAQSPKVTWRERTGIKFLEEGGFSVARFENLAEGQTWFLRIRSVNEIGRRSEPSATFRLATRPTPRTGLWWILGGLALAATAFWGFRKMRALRDADDASDAERIARLDNR